MRKAAAAGSAPVAPVTSVPVAHRTRSRQVASVTPVAPVAPITPITPVATKTLGKSKAMTDALARVDAAVARRDPALFAVRAHVKAPVEPIRPLADVLYNYPKQFPVVDGAATLDKFIPFVVKELINLDVDWTTTPRMLSGYNTQSGRHYVLSFDNAVIAFNGSGTFIKCRIDNTRENKYQLIQSLHDICRIDVPCILTSAHYFYDEEENPCGSFIDGSEFEVKLSVKPSLPADVLSALVVEDMSHNKRYIDLI